MAKQLAQSHTPFAEPVFEPKQSALQPTQQTAFLQWMKQMMVHPSVHTVNH